MARFDKIEPNAGSFRAALGFQPVSSDVGKIIAVKLDTAGKVIKTTDGVTYKGVICLSELLNLGDRVDVMMHGEIVDATGLTAGTSYTAAAGGALAAGAGVGFTIEAWKFQVQTNGAGA